LAIARALIFEPPLLLADEPTGNLDSQTGDEILRLLDRLHAELNMTILLVTHNEEAALFCNRVLRVERRPRGARGSVEGGACMIPRTWSGDITPVEQPPTADIADDTWHCARSRGALRGTDGRM
jgi:ABC-type nitrate/sulfonate/bicarbonate transport system ATPase subunit